ncbi:EAL domain-containing protein [Undibacterium sp. Ji49W]|uniref:EAL domain-containing protein n=1 Tax=Undibacterium sp. Ji49W TaxID=3413040 RepID=UPI003BF1E899
MATILIVDDHALNRQFLAALLNFQHHKLLLASDGLEGLKLALQEHPDLVISDILMPHMNGYEFVLRIRTEPSIANIPVIFYTSTYSTREADVMARSCGVKWVLEKPSPPDLILKTVRDALGTTTPVKIAALPLNAPQAGNRFGSIDHQLTEYLRELESSSQLISKIAEDTNSQLPQNDEVKETNKRLSQSLADLQAVSLRLTALIDMGIELNSERDPIRLLESGCRVARHVCVAKYAVAGIVHSDYETILNSCVRGLEPKFSEYFFSLPIATGVLGKLLRQKNPVRFENPGGNPERVGLPVDHPPVHSFLGVPIASSKRCYGWIYLVDKFDANEFNEIDEQTVMTVATQLAIAYENLDLFEVVQEHANRLEIDLAERKRIADQLYESETRFRQLAENIDEVFFLIDPVNVVVLYISPAYEKIWGRSCLSLYAKPQSWRESIYPDDMSAIQLAEKNWKFPLPVTADHNFDHRYRIIRSDGVVRWIHVRGFPIRNDAGDIYRIAGVAEDITAQENLQTSLLEREAGLQRAQLIAKLSHVITQSDGSFESWSATLPQLVGTTSAALPTNTRDWLSIIEPIDRERFRAISVAAGKSKQRQDIEYRIRRGDGELIHVRQVMEPLPDKNYLDSSLRWFNTIQNVTEQKIQQQNIAHLNRIYAVLSGINSAIVRIRNRNELLHEACRVLVNQGEFCVAWASVLDANTNDIIMSAWSVCEIGDSKNPLVKAIKSTINNGAASAVFKENRPIIYDNIQTDLAQSALKTKFLENGFKSLIALPLTLDNQVISVIVVVADSIACFSQKDTRKLFDELAGDLSFGLQFIEKEERLNYLAYYDALTGLPNSMLFHDRLTQLLHASFNSDDLVAVIMINLDHFAQFNEVHGRHSGDAILKLVANHLSAGLKEPYSLARVGGDIFAIAFGAIKREADVIAQLTQQILEPLGQTFKLSQHEIRLSIRAGIALYPADGEDAETLYKHAEVALKKAKSSTEQYLYYSRKMNEAIAERIALENALKEALENGQFEIYYQPRVDLRIGSIVSAEALIRWHHPVRGQISPIEFIPLAEDTGQIVAIGEWVIDTVSAQQALWRQEKIEIVPVAINLSAVQFKKGKILQTVRDIVAKYELPQEYIEFELTESVVMDEPIDAISNLQELKDLGSKLSLDDFGTGYSSLAYLKRFPFDFIKIDRAFITDVCNSPEDAAIAKAIIAMAHSLGLRVVAEGVETMEQLQFLLDHHCDELQGYYFSPPVPAKKFLAMLVEGKRLTTTLQKKNA